MRRAPTFLWKKVGKKPTPPNAPTRAGWCRDGAINKALKSYQWLMSNQSTVAVSDTI